MISDPDPAKGTAAPSELDAFPARTAGPEGRRALQLTNGPEFCYPLYYFVPSITADGRYMLLHRETPGEHHEIQLERLDLHTGEARRLTAAGAEDAEWHPWGKDPARGVSGDRSALAPQRGLAVYFDGREARSVNLLTLEDRPLFTVEPGRKVISQSCFTGDEQWFVYVEADEALFHQWVSGTGGRETASMVQNTAVRACHLDSGAHRTLFRLDYPVHHVHPVGSRGIGFSHVPGDLHGLGLAHVDRSDYRIARPRDEAGRKIIHHVPTEAGIAYETTAGNAGRHGGILDPETSRRLEWPVPNDVTHTGFDPLGRLFFYYGSAKKAQFLRRTCRYPRMNDRGGSRHGRRRASSAGPQSPYVLGSVSGLLQAGQDVHPLERVCGGASLGSEAEVD